jgi:hypothetical protein
VTKEPSFDAKASTRPVAPCARCQLLGGLDPKSKKDRTSPARGELDRVTRRQARESPAGDRDPGKSIRAFGTALEPLVGTKGACSALGRSRATHYRHRKGPRLSEMNSTAPALSKPLTNRSTIPSTSGSYNATCGKCLHREGSDRTMYRSVILRHCA